MMVAIAAQRNQKSAAGAITLLIAGFSASGIFGIEGVCTKLKYQSRPIHFTPAVTCSQRMAKSHQACSPTGILAPMPARMMRSTMSTTTPAVMVLPSDWKNAAIVFSFCSGVASEKSLHPSPRAGQQPARGDHQHQYLCARQDQLQPFALGGEQGQQARIAERGHQGEKRHGREVEDVAIAEEGQPRPLLRCAGRRDEPVYGQRPVARQLGGRDERGHHAAYVEQERGERDGEPRLGRPIEPAGVELAQLAFVFRQLHSPVPLASARSPATSITTMTNRRTTDAGVVPSILAPIREPSITPRIEGTAMSGSTAPRWIWTQAAELLMTEITSPLEPTATLSGADMRRFSAGTLAKPAPRPKMPPIKPIAAKEPRPRRVRCVRQSMRSPAAGSWYSPSSRSSAPR